MKTAEEIYESLKAAFLEKSGKEVREGGDMAVRLWAAAAQLESLYIYSDWVKRQSFPQTAQGENLDSHAAMRGLSRTGAAKAEGKIRFFIKEALDTELTVPAGTMCLTASEVYFKTVTPAVIMPGELYADAEARAEEAGAGGNVAAGSIVFMSPAPVGVSSCQNTEAFSGGEDTEDDESLRKRILYSFKKLPNGANKAYYESEALSISGVAAVQVLPKNRGLGTVDIIVSSAEGMPSADILEAVKERLDTSREICVDISITAPEEKSVSVQCEILESDGYDFESVKSGVLSAINGLFNGELLGKGVTLAQLGNVIFGVEGVSNYRISSPAADIEAAEGVLPVLQEASINLWS